MSILIQTEVLFFMACLLLLSLIVWAGFGAGATLQRVYERNRVRAFHKKAWQERIEEAIARRHTAEREVFSWSGYRKFNVIRKVREANDIFSFYLAPHDQKHLPPFHPGQYLTFRFKVPGEDKPILRCYSLSDCARDGYYRITVKRLPAMNGRPAGKASNYLLDKIEEGSILDVQAPKGHFFMDVASRKGVVLIGGGVGITPLLAMIHAIQKREQQRPVWLFYGVRNSEDHAMKGLLEEMVSDLPNVQMRVAYSKPLPTDVLNTDYHVKGRLSSKLLKETLPSNNFEYYICGPSAMMTEVTTFLNQWGVPKDHVHFEAFGPASVAEVQTSSCPVTPPGKSHKITFAQSGKTADWTPDKGSLLELAEDNGIPIDSGCRVGNCSSCIVAVRSGDVCYLNEPGAPPEAGSCLTCIAVPTSDMELDV